MRKAFTLAEVLITLGIIGVVAALTMPAIIISYQKKQTSAQLKKAYSTFAQVLVQAQYEFGDASSWVLTEPSSSYQDNLKYFEKYWKPYLKIIKVCTTMNECGYDITGYASVANKNHHVYYGQADNVPGFIYGDGTYAYIRPYHYSSTVDNPLKLQLLSIDLNGSKKPNTIGKDVFQFVIDMSRGVISGFGDKNNCTVNKLNNDIEHSRACGGKIMSDGWEILDDYPW